MFIIDKQSRVPVYEQLINRMEELIASGALPADSQIPSVRSLAVELTVNPNTIQKAYTALENAGITYSVAGVGRFVSMDAAKIIEARGTSRMSEFRSAVNRLRMTGVGEQALINIIKEEFSKGERE